MDPYIIAIIAILCQYPVAVLSLVKLFFLKWDKIPTIVWNFVIVLLPFIGVISFWIYYLVNRKKLEEKRKNKEEESIVAAQRRAEEEEAKNGETDTENENKDTETTEIEISDEE